MFSDADCDGFSEKETCSKNFRQNDIVYENVTVYETFDISIALKLSKNTHSSWPNIFGFQQENVPSWQSTPPHRPRGGKVPAVFLNRKSNSLHICMAIDNNGNSCWDSEVMPVDTWFTLNIRQQLLDGQHKFQILIDNDLKQTVINNQPMVFENVNGIIANAYQPERDYPTPVGQYKDFRFISEGNNSIKFALI